MQPREAAARALGVGADAIVSVEPIKHGLTNQSWLVRTGNDAVVVRLSSRHWLSLQIDRLAETSILRAVAQAGIGAEVIAADLPHGLLVTRYLGPTCTEAHMTDAAFIERLGALFAQLHATAIPADAREVHLPTVIGGYLDTLHTLNRTSALVAPELRERGLMLAAEMADTCAPRLCHNDVHHLNVVDGKRTWLIDWEYAGSGEPYFDLASVCVYHHYSLEQRRCLLRAYQGESATASLERLSKCCWLFEYVRDLWTEVRGLLETR
jgi:thiamine kinase